MSTKIALVTGGTGGIGTMICRTLANEGYKVAAAYNKGGDHNWAKSWKDQQAALGYSIETVYGNVTDFDSAGIMVSAAEEVLGPISILVNNAGITNDATFRKMEPKQWHSVIQANLDSVFNVTKQVINGMMDRQYGRIINIASINGQKGQFGQTNYAASKAGMHGFTKSLALEVARKGVTVNTISPGYIQTDMMKDVPMEVLEKIIAQIPVGRLGLPEEVARLVAFLSDEKSSFITGADLSINGGQFMF